MLYRIALIFYILSVLSSLYAKTKLENITLQLDWKHQFEYAGFYAAKSQGYYKDVGLNVHFKEFKNGDSVVNYVLNHSNAYGITYSNLILDYLDGKPVVFLANFFKRSPLALVTQSNIKLPNQLIGKKIMGLSDVAYNIEFLKMFRAFGISENDIRNVPPTFNINAFKDKKVDGMVIYTTNELYYLQKNMLAFNIFKPADYGAEFYDLNLFTSKEELINHPLQVKNFRDASIKGWEYALSHKEQIINLILKKYNTQHKTHAALEFEANQTQIAILPSIFPIGSIDPMRVKRMAEDFKEMGLVPKETPFDFSGFIYNYQRHDSRLTKAQEKFLRAKGTLRLCVDPDWMPIESIQNGKYIGISAGIFHLLYEKYNLNIELHPTHSWKQSLEAAKARRCDIFTAASATQKRLQYMNFTKPYLNIPIVLATKMDKPYTYNFYTLRNKSIGVVRGYAIGPILEKKYPDMHIVYVKNIQDGLKQVESGKIYGYVDNLMCLAYTIQHSFTNQIKISARVNENVGLAVGTRNDEPMLHTIFQKLLYTIPAKDMQHVVNNWVSIQENPKNTIGFKTFFKILGILLIIGIAFLYHYYKLRKYSKELRRLSVTDSLTGLYNRMHIDTVLQNQYNLSQRYMIPCGVIMLDIDYFKEINDTYGHLVGDNVLQTFAKLIQQNIRTTDIAGRWGGEEFLIICPYADLAQTAVVANHIRQKIIEYKFSNIDNQITASFGVSCYNQDVKMDDIIKCVDDALYRSKKEGRNKITITDC